MQLSTRSGMVSGCSGTFSQTNRHCIRSWKTSWGICLRRRRNASDDAGSAAGHGRHANEWTKRREGNFPSSCRTYSANVRLGSSRVGCHRHVLLAHDRHQYAGLPRESRHVVGHSVAPASSHSFKQYSWGSPSPDRPSSRSIVSTPRQEPARALPARASVAQSHPSWK
jgi:hypothetical protein